jgi:monoterpene epsilon-lactone hydrolase
MRIKKAKVFLLVSPELQKVTNLLRKWRDKTKPTVQAYRKALNYMVSTQPVPKDITCVAVDAGGVPAEWISAPDINPKHIIIYYHGGGWVAGSGKNSRESLGRLSRATNTKVLSVDYRLAPEHPYPAAVDDAFAAYMWLLSTKVPPKNIIMGGESAGGNLTAVTLLKARDAKLPLPAAAILISPATDLAQTGGSFVSKVDEDPLFSPAWCAVMVAGYLPDIDLLRDPTVSPIYANLRGLPPLFIQVGSAEILIDHSTHFAEKAKKAGVPVELDIIEGGIHAVVLFPATIPEVAQAMNKIAKFVGQFFKIT